MKFFATTTALACLALAGLVNSAAAQCATCPQATFAPQPTVALSPVTQVAYSPVVAQPTVAYSPVAVQQPVVLQTVPPARPLFSGRILRRIFGYPETVVVAPGAPAAVAPVATTAARPILGGSPTFVTAAYQPTYPLTAAVAVPQFQTVARPVALTTTTFRPVALSPACCPTASCCPTACPTCASGVTTASFNAPASCPNCAASSTSTFTQPYTPTTPTPAGETPRPGLDPNAAVPDQRLRPLPDSSTPDSSLLNNNGPASPSDTGSGSKDFNFGGESDAYWEAPQLFNPNARTTSRPSAPVWNAVYSQGGEASNVRSTVYKVGPDASEVAPRRQQQGASGWRSVSN